MVRIIDYYFYICSIILQRGYNEPSVTMGALGVGTLYGYLTFCLIDHLKWPVVQLIFDGSCRSILFFAFLILFSILTFYYYKRNNRGKKIIEYFYQKHMKYKHLIYFVSFILYVGIGFVGVPSLIRWLIGLIN